MLLKVRSWENFPQTMNIIGSVGLKCQSEGALASFSSLIRHNCLFCWIYNVQLHKFLSETWQPVKSQSACAGVGDWRLGAATDVSGRALNLLCCVVVVHGGQGTI